MGNAMQGKRLRCPCPANVNGEGYGERGRAMLLGMELEEAGGGKGGSDGAGASDARCSLDIPLSARWEGGRASMTMGGGEGGQETV